MEFYTILYKNEFQNPQIFQQTISLFPEQSTLQTACIFRSFNWIDDEGISVFNNCGSTINKVKCLPKPAAAQCSVCIITHFTAR
jgi:hypothetical protein